MNENNLDWKNSVSVLLDKLGEKAKVTNRFVDLEDLAVNAGEEIKRMILQGIVSEKGDGSNLPKQEGMGKLKNKGTKKKE